MTKSWLAIESQWSNLSTHEILLRYLPTGNFRKIAIKPNWVMHETNPLFPISALITSSQLLDDVIESCIEKYPMLEEITIGDVPLQTCEWELMCLQSGLDQVIKKWAATSRPAIRFLDLRKERFKMVDGFQKASPDSQMGDPKGYRVVLLGNDSYLEAISGDQNRFRVSDYDPRVMASRHSKGTHSYFIAGSLLDCDLFINMPKMKTHQKSGFTGALKNLVGMNAEKACLVHYRLGKPNQGGDEFPPSVSNLVYLQTRVRELLQKRSAFLFRLLRYPWLMLRNLSGIQTEGSSKNLTDKFYIAGGAWYGNDTIWRMIYDLNRIIIFAPSSGGKLSDSPQREYIAILDGTVSGEGNGPLQPLPVVSDFVAVSNNPFLIDFAGAEMMGFDYGKIPSLSNFRSFTATQWTDFDPAFVSYKLNGEECTGIQNIPKTHFYIPPPGWAGHIEK